MYIYIHLCVQLEWESLTTNFNPRSKTIAELAHMLVDDLVGPVCTCMYVCMYACMNVCIHMHTYIYIHRYTYIHCTYMTWKFHVRAHPTSTGGSLTFLVFLSLVFSVAPRTFSYTAKMGCNTSMACQVIVQIGYRKQLLHRYTHMHKTYSQYIYVYMLVVLAHQVKIIYIFIYVCVCACIYLYIFNFVYIYIHIYMLYIYRYVVPHGQVAMPS